MSSINKILLAVVVLLLIGVLSIALYASTEHSHNLTLSQALAKSSEELRQANESLARQSVVSDITETVVTNAVEKTKATTKKTQETVKKVDNITKQVANEKISSSDADIAYINSMWDAYCEAKPRSVKCTSRQPAP